MTAKCSWCGKKSVLVMGDKAACTIHSGQLLDEYNQHVIEVRRKGKRKNNV